MDINKYTHYIYRVLKDCEEARKNDNILIAKTIELKAIEENQYTDDVKSFVNGLINCSEIKDFPQMASITRIRRILQSKDSSIIDEETYKKRMHLCEEDKTLFTQILLDDFFEAV